MTTNFDSDVTVVGYGPTGITAALTLAKAGVRVTVIERDSDIYARARAVTVNDWTMRIFQALGIDDRIEAVIEPQRALRWVTYAGQEVMRVEHPASTLGTRNSKPRFYNIYQPTMEAELRKCVEEYGDRVTVLFGQEATGIAQDEESATVSIRDTATGETREIRSEYVIGADGGSSATRERLGISLDGDTVNTQWIVIDCRVKRWWPDRDFLTFWTDAKRRAGWPGRSTMTRSSAAICRSR